MVRRSLAAQAPRRLGQVGAVRLCQFARRVPVPAAPQSNPNLPERPSASSPPADSVGGHAKEGRAGVPPNSVPRPLVVRCRLWGRRRPRRLASARPPGSVQGVWGTPGTGLRGGAGRCVHAPVVGMAACGDGRPRKIIGGGERRSRRPHRTRRGGREGHGLPPNLARVSSRSIVSRGHPPPAEGPVVMARPQRRSAEFACTPAGRPL